MIALKYGIKPTHLMIGVVLINTAVKTLFGRPFTAEVLTNMLAACGVASLFGLALYLIILGFLKMKERIAPVAIPGEAS